MRYKYKHILISFVVMLGASLLVIILAWTSLRPLNQKNGFTRVIYPRKINIVSAAKKMTDVVDFSGYTDHHLYWKTSDPSRIFQTGADLQDGNYLNLKIKYNKKLASAFYCWIDSPDITILGGRLPAIITANQDSSTNVYNFPPQLFTRGVKIGTSSFIFRGFDTSVHSMDQVFLKANLSNRKIQLERNVSELRGDGGISTDGTLHYDDKTKLLAYIYFYENKFICLDTNLNLIKRGTTIDTVSTYTGNAAEVSSKNSITNLRPTRFVNSLNCISDGLLFNNSKLKGDNEDLNTFKQNSVIDIYDLKTGQYRKSFYVPSYNQQRMVQFKVIRNSLIAIYKNDIVKYALTGFL